LNLAKHGALLAKSHFLGLDFDRLDLGHASNWLMERRAGDPFAYIVTPNVDHMVQIETRPVELRHLYEQAALCLCDSRVLAGLARLTGIAMTVVPGSDLVLELFARVLHDGDTICLVGGSNAVAARLQALYPGIKLVHHEPPMGLRHDAAARQAAIAAVARARARFTLLAVGCPQQEILAWEIQQSQDVTGTALCIGASVEFMLGEQRRAPLPVQKAGLEWGWRLLGNPRRLARRYLWDGPLIFPLVWRWRTERNRLSRLDRL
jgi:N-acetylglucosaminyldiphosphoundecaprenol N-acetyl-beta-D-mannosaminyltransferase